MNICKEVTILKEKLPYLTEEEKKRGKMLIREMDDAMNALRTELNETQHPYKHYIKEKLRVLQTDVPCLASLLEDEEGDDENDEEIL